MRTHVPARQYCGKDKCDPSGRAFQVGFGLNSLLQNGWQRPAALSICFLVVYREQDKELVTQHL